MNIVTLTTYLRAKYLWKKGQAKSLFYGSHDCYTITHSHNFKNGPALALIYSSP